MNILKNSLDALLDTRDPKAALRNDPLSFVHRYATAEDQEIAAVFAAQLAYGRVSLFFPVITALLDEADRFGGPRSWINGFDKLHSQRIEHIYYRLNKSPDFALLAMSLKGVCTEFGSLFSCFSQGYNQEDTNLNPALNAFITHLEYHAKEYALTLGETGIPLPRSFRHMLSKPANGSACKRWNLFLRWMVRTEFPDLGRWNFPTEKLVIPLDTHVHQISLLLGLCTQKSANNKTAQQITYALSKLDAKDPIRYDFAIAHLGISGNCQKKHIPHICNACALQSVCTVEKNK